MRSWRSTVSVPSGRISAATPASASAPTSSVPISVPSVLSCSNSGEALSACQSSVPVPLSAR